MLMAEGREPSLQCGSGLVNVQWGSGYHRRSRKASKSSCGRCLAQRHRAPPGHLQLHRGLVQHPPHSSLSYLSPAQWEAAHRTAVTQAA